jgi:hypothetical protein
MWASGVAPRYLSPLVAVEGVGQVWCRVAGTTKISLENGQSAANMMCKTDVIERAERIAAGAGESAVSTKSRLSSGAS